MTGATAGERRVRTRLGPHRLTDLLHETSHRAIYRAVEAGSQREVLLMVLSEELSADPRVRDRFGVRMGQAAGVLERHLAPLRRWGPLDALLCAELGPLSGTGLRTLLEHRPLTPEAALDLVADVAAAVDAAHARGLAHLGLSPSVVVVGGDDVARVTDLGLSAVLAEVGTAPEPADASYRAPELPPTVDPDSTLAARADVYALTALLHDALTGTGPAASTVQVGPSLVGLLHRGTGTPAERPVSGDELVRAARFALHDGAEAMPLPPRRPPTRAAPDPVGSPGGTPAPAGSWSATSATGGPPPGRADQRPRPSAGSPTRQVPPRSPSSASGRASAAAAAAAGAGAAAGRPGAGGPGAGGPGAGGPGAGGSAVGRPGAGRPAAGRAGAAAATSGWDTARSPSRPAHGSRAAPVLAVLLVVLALVAVGGFLWLLLGPSGDRSAAPGVPPATSSADPSPGGGAPTRSSSDPSASTAPRATPSAPSTPARPPLPAGATECAADADPRNGLTGSASGTDNTSCEFAEATRTQLAGESDPFAADQIEVVSPVTGQDYTLDCSAADRLITCSGGDNAVVLVW